MIRWTFPTSYITLHNVFGCFRVSYILYLMLSFVEQISLRNSCLPVTQVFQTLKTILHFSAHFGKVEIRESKYFNDNSEGKIETIHVINFSICKNWVQEKIGFLKVAYYLKGWIFSPKVWLFLCSNLVRKRWKLL